MNQRLEHVNRIILSVGHGGLAGENYDPGAVNPITNEKENIVAKQIVVNVASYLISNGLPVLILPDYGLSKTVTYVNSVGDAHTDWAFEIHKDSFGNYNPDTMKRRMGIYFHPTSQGSKEIAEGFVKIWKDTGAHSTSWTRPDTSSNHGSLAWIRKTNMLAHLIEAGFIQDSNEESDNDFYSRLIANAICDAMDITFNG